jgi:nicotinamide-nucleotide amidase
MGDVNLPEVVGKLLLDQKLKVGTVESCTGGSIASAITSVSGSSAYFEGSIVSYSPEVKMDLVGVEKSTIEEFGIVSRQVAEEMAIGGKVKLKTDYCIGITGNASISPSLEEDEVGVICIAIAGNERVLSKKFRMEKDRSRNIRRSVLTALNLLRCELMKINIEKS